MRSSSSAGSIDAPGRFAPFAYGLGFIVLGLIVAYLNRHHLEQQSNYFNEYVSMADHYRGRSVRALMTYPLWGYSAVLLLLPRDSLVLVPQVLLAAVAAAATLVVLQRELPTHRRALAILFVVGAPWYLLHSVKWPQSFAASLCVIGLVGLARAYRRASVVDGALAGVAFGLALNFRSEFLYLPIFIALTALATRFLRRFSRVPVAPALAAAVAAWLVMVPWAIHYHRETGRYALTTSQRGIVSFISLGQLPGNPWGAEYLDEYAYDYLREQGIGVVPQSDSGDRVLYAEFKHRVREHPLAFARKVAWNAMVTLVGGFYSGEIPLTAREQQQLDQLRQDARAMRLGAVASDVTGGPVRVTFAFGYWVLAKTLGAVFVMIGVAGLCVAAWRGIRSPLLLLSAAYVTYQLLLMLALATEPRYLNGLYLAFVPFVLLCVAAARDWWRRRSPADARPVPVA